MVFQQFLALVRTSMASFTSKRWDASQIPDLTSRVAVVTGGNTGLGYITCLELARHGAKVYMASRTEARAKQAIERIKAEVPGAQVEFLYFDLTILRTAKSAAEEFMSKEQRLDILVNNAGIMTTPYELSPDGIEGQACNGIGHFALTAHLLPILKKTDESIQDSHVRIVNLSSIAHQAASNPDFSDLKGLNRTHNSTWVRYGNSKLSNILHINQLQKKLENTHIYCLAVHPGIVATELFRGLERSFSFFAILKRWLLSTPYQGALTQLYAATSPEVETKNLKGSYLVPYAQVAKKSKLAQDADGKLGQQFWDLCERLMEEDENRPH